MSSRGTGEPNGSEVGSEALQISRGPYFIWEIEKRGFLGQSWIALGRS